jgi:hypothetical protein
VDESEWWCETEETPNGSLWVLLAATLKFEMDSWYADWIVSLEDLLCITPFIDVRLDESDGA